MQVPSKARRGSTVFLPHSNFFFLPVTSLSLRPLAEDVPLGVASRHRIERVPLSSWGDGRADEERNTKLVSARVPSSIAQLMGRAFLCSGLIRQRPVAGENSKAITENPYRWLESNSAIAHAELPYCRMQCDMVKPNTQFMRRQTGGGHASDEGS